MTLTAAVVAFPGVAGGKPANAPVRRDATEAADRQAAARSLFQQGLNNLRAERWADAADRFERALALKPTPEIAYNLSSALLHLGKLVRASEVLRQAAADPGASEPVRQAAAARLEQVLPRIAYLTVRIDGPPDGVVVSLDGRPLDAAMLSVPIPVNPSSHALIAMRGAEPIYEQTLEVQEGERVPLTVVVPSAASEPPELPTASLEALRAVDGDATQSSPATRAGTLSAFPGKVWLWALVGAVAAGTIAAVVIGSGSGAEVVPGTVTTIDYGAP